MLGLLGVRTCATPRLANIGRGRHIDSTHPATKVLADIASAPCHSTKVAMMPEQYQLSRRAPSQLHQVATLCLLALLCGCGSQQPSEPIVLPPPKTTFSSPTPGLTTSSFSPNRSEGATTADQTAPPIPPLETRRMIVMGDSISAGLGASHATLTYAALLLRNSHMAYPFHQGLDLNSHFGPYTRFINVAHSGDTTDDVAQFQLKALVPALVHAPTASASLPVRGHTLVFLTAGGNDIRLQLQSRQNIGGKTLDHALANLRTIFRVFWRCAAFP